MLLTGSVLVAEPVVKDTDIAKLRDNLVKQRDVLYLQGSQFNSPAMTKCAEQLDETIAKLDKLPRVDAVLAKSASKDVRKSNTVLPTIMPVVFPMFL